MQHEKSRCMLCEAILNKNLIIDLKKVISHMVHIRVHMHVVHTGIQRNIYT